MIEVVQWEGARLNLKLKGSISDTRDTKAVGDEFRVTQSAILYSFWFAINERG